MVSIQDSSGLNRSILAVKTDESKLNSSKSQEEIIEPGDSPNATFKEHVGKERF